MVVGTEVDLTLSVKHRGGCGMVLYLLPFCFLLMLFVKMVLMYRAIERKHAELIDKLVIHLYCTFCIMTTKPHSFLF